MPTQGVHEARSRRKGENIGLRWIDINKGDYDSPNYRSRLVGRELNTCKDDSLYAATPHPETLRLNVSHAATIRRGGWSKGRHWREAHREMMVNDVSRAYFYAPATRSLFI